MIPVLFSTYNNLGEVLAAVNTNGNGPLEVIRATVSEELNGAYTAELTIALSGQNAERVKVGDYIKLSIPKNAYAQDDLFRISKIKKSMNQTLTIYAEHISYALNNVGVKPFTLVNGLAATLAKIKANTITQTPFTFTGSTADPFGYELEKPATVREIIGSLSDNIIKQFLVEVQWVRNRVIFKPERGSDKGYTIEYGKNLIDYNQETSIEKMVDGVTGYAKSGNTYYYDTFMITPRTYPKMLTVDLTQEIDPSSPMPIQQQLENALGLYIARHDIEEPEVNIALNFLHLGDTDQYKGLDLENIQLGDTITVNFPKLDVYNVKSKMIAYTWDCIEERYTGIQIGTPKQTIEESIAQYIRK